MARKSSILGKISSKLEGLDIDIYKIDEEMLKEIHLAFYDISDERNDSYTYHFLPDIVFIVLFSVLSNCKEWDEIYEFANIHYNWFKKYLKLPCGIPSVSTFQRIIAIISPAELESILVNIILSTLKDYEEIFKIEKEKDITSLDGKVCNKSKRSNSINGKIKSVNAMSAFSSRYEVALTTMFIGEKTNEIPEAQKVLKTMNLKKTIVTLDSLQ